MRAAEDDQQKYKAFRASHKGVVLGIQFATTNITWQLSQGKLSAFLHLISVSISPPNLSLKKVQIPFSKLKNSVQQAPAMSLLAVESSDFLRDILFQQLKIRSKEEDDHTYKVLPQ